MAESVHEGSFAMSTLEDSRAYVQECPLDSRRLRPSVYVHVLALMIVKGPELTLNSPDLKVCFLSSLPHAHDMLKN